MLPVPTNHPSLSVYLKNLPSFTSHRQSPPGGWTGSCRSPVRVPRETRNIAEKYRASGPGGGDFALRSIKHPGRYPHRLPPAFRRINTSVLARMNQPDKLAFPPGSSRRLEKFDDRRCWRTAGDGGCRGRTLRTGNGDTVAAR